MESRTPEKSAELLFLESLTQALTLAPEHEILSRLVGAWAIEGKWYDHAEQSVSLRGRLVNTLMFGGQYLESRVYYQDAEHSLTLYAYDSQETQFVAISINASSTCPEIEYGQFDEAADQLCFCSTEYMGPQKMPIAVERTLSFLSADNYEMRLVYPDFEPGPRLAMVARFERQAHSDTPA